MWADISRYAYKKIYSERNKVCNKTFYRIAGSRCCTYVLHTSDLTAISSKVSSSGISSPSPYLVACTLL